MGETIKIIDLLKSIAENKIPSVIWVEGIKYKYDSNDKRFYDSNKHEVDLNLYYSYVLNLEIPVEW